MRTHTWIRWIAVAGAATLLVTACSADKDKGSGDDAKKVSIASLMGAPDYENVDYDAQQQQIEEAVAKCMIAEGWEYIPVKYPDSGFSGEYSDEDAVAQIEREGLGITYYLLNDGSNGDNPDDPWADFVDPNQDYISTLSEAEQIAYQGSLYGTEEEQSAASTTEIDPETGEEYTSMSGSLGCQGQAYTEVNGNDITQTPEFWDAMQGYYEELQLRVEADPRIIKMTDAWSKCMADAGYDYENQEAYYEHVYTDLQDRANAVMGDSYGKDPMEGWTQEQMDDFWATASEDEVNALFNTQSQLTADQRSQLEEIFAEEVKIGLTEHTCSKDMNEGATEVYTDIEEQYALEHEDELKALAVSLGSKE